MKYLMYKKNQLFDDIQYLLLNGTFLNLEKKKHLHQKATET